MASRALTPDEEELGDLLFQVVFHSVLAAEEGQFTLADVARGIHDKLYARHPHVFEPGAAATDVAQLTVDWERRKVEEKGRASVMDGIPAALPALAYAAKVQKKAASQGSTDAGWYAVRQATARDAGPGRCWRSSMRPDSLGSIRSWRCAEPSSRSPTGIGQRSQGRSD